MHLRDLSYTSLLKVKLSEMLFNWLEALLQMYLHAKLELSRINQVSFERSLTYLDISSEDIELSLVNEDLINISSSGKALSRSVELTGEFVRPGVYSFEPGETILDVINRAGGLTEESYDEGAVFIRESVATSQEVLRGLQMS